MIVYLSTKTLPSSFLWKCIHAAQVNVGFATERHVVAPPVEQDLFRLVSKREHGRRNIVLDPRVENTSSHAKVLGKDVVHFHTGVREVYPDRIFAFGYTPLYAYAKAGFSAEQIRFLGGRRPRQDRHHLAGAAYVGGQRNQHAHRRLCAGLAAQRHCGIPRDGGEAVKGTDAACG
ncbi:Uu.00g034690.m01.CDS01 [Anthostomella pinea]|uniref:Uu.00g034690.m01.CDS01 n=1 Tax=Anthostomella pinea TaxID=933095 RepID=A0AAI8V937_9PEZI|nr:Uu.00g034690.m01.CDS01 [Anthostomella pinea]